MASEIDNTKSSSKSIVNDRLTIVYAEMVPSEDTTLQASNSTSTESSESSEDSSKSSSLSFSSPTESMKGLLEKLDDDKDKDYHFGYEPVWRTMSTTDGSKMKSLDYFRSRRIFQLFTFFISHLLAHAPEEPLDFLLSLVDRCLAYRDQGADPPLLFEDKHILSVYTALDPMDVGFVYYHQYTAGMATLGLSEFNLLPEDMDETKEVVKETFLKEAKVALLDQLDGLLGSPQPKTAASEVTALVEQEVNSCTLGTRSEEIMSRLYTSPGSSRHDRLSADMDLIHGLPQEPRLPRSVGSITPSIASNISLKSLEI